MIRLSWLGLPDNLYNLLPLVVDPELVAGTGAGKGVFGQPRWGDFVHGYGFGLNTRRGSLKRPLLGRHPYWVGSQTKATVCAGGFVNLLNLYGLSEEAT